MPLLLPLLDHSLGYETVTAVAICLSVEACVLFVLILIHGFLVDFVFLLLDLLINVIFFARHIIVGRLFN